MNFRTPYEIIGERAARLETVAPKGTRSSFFLTGFEVGLTLALWYAETGQRYLDSINSTVHEGDTSVAEMINYLVAQARVS